MKKLLVVVALALLMMLIPKAALADEAYDIISDDVHITVSENNVMDVEERLHVNFKQQRHGIYYNLQYQGTIYHELNGETVESKYKYRIYDFNVVQKDFELSKESDSYGKYIVAKIGDPNILVSGEQEYVIRYKCDMGDNGFDGFDEFYGSVLFCGYGNTIQNASFKIDLPKDFDESLVNVVVGQYMSSYTRDVVWEKAGNSLKGYMLRPLQGGERVTVRMVFPDDYFVGESNPAAGWSTVIYIVSGICVLTAIILWAALGRDNRIFPTVEFYAPDGMTPAEAGYVIDGCVDDKDVISLLLFWADKGYLKINEKEKNDFELVKVRSLPEDAKSYEKSMFEKLFYNRDAVYISSLKQSFYITMESTKTSVTNYFESGKHRRVFTEASKKARAAMGIITMIPIALVIFFGCYGETDSIIWSIGLAVFIGWIISLPVFMLVSVFEKWRSTPKAKRLFKLIFSVVVLAVVFAIYIFGVPYYFDADSNIDSLSVTVVTAASTLLMGILTIIMRKRTKQGAEWFAKLLGFKNFIEKAEKDRILRLVEENPSYFYNVLPYAYVLGVTDKWAKNFEGIGIQPPVWYSGYYGMHTFNTIIFASYMSRNLSGFQSVMTSRPAPSGKSGGFGGGGFGGGGFSGGGFGGGGAGGSW
ncbi:MAG: DUF2207 domain-containing protein [Christensenellales bacterium]